MGYFNSRACAVVLFLANVSVAATAPIDDARASFIDLTHVDWKFKTDPNKIGEQNGWALSAFDDSSWGTIQAGSVWEQQGYPGYDGLAWYRTTIWVPAEWKGSVIRFETDGVGDYYDVFVGGNFVREQGGNEFGSFYLWPTRTEIQSALTYGAWNTIAIRVIDLGWSDGGGMWRRAAVRRIPPLENYKNLLPQPVVDGHPEWLDAYWKSWNLLWENMSYGDSHNGLASAFIEENFNEQIYQWDSCFMTFFARYGAKVFPVMSALDNFYAKQRSDGYIQRSYSATTGIQAEVPTAAEPAVNPPLFAWAELEYAKFSGDTSRLARVLPKLEKYFDWVKANMRGQPGRGLYFNTQLGSGMDNTPRGDADGAGWVDMTMQQALAAKSLGEIAQLIGARAQGMRWEKEYTDLKTLIDANLWSEHDKYYYDLQRSGELAGVRHVGAYWALLAQVPDAQKASGFLWYLSSPYEFNRPTMFPTLSASNPYYNYSGYYWRGSVWAPTNYMTIKGLELYDGDQLAHDATASYLAQISRVYHANLDNNRISALDRIDGYLHTVWECYSPEWNVPCSNGPNTGFARANFVGWSGLGPISLLIENYIGLRVNAIKNEIVWDLRETDRVGVNNLSFGKSAARVSLVAQADEGRGRQIEVSSETEFSLQVNYHDKKFALKILPGDKNVFILE